MRFRSTMWEEIVFKGRQTCADELILAKSREDVIKSFGAVNFWTGGSSEKKKEKA